MSAKISGSHSFPTSATLSALLQTITSTTMSVRETASPNETHLPAFVAPSPVRTTSLRTCRAPAPRRKPPISIPRRARVVLAVQTSPVSGDSDGDLTGAPSNQKSYSVGVTIVSGCDHHLRRNVIEKIATNSPAGRIVVVTAGGLVSTDEHENDPALDLADDPVPLVNGFESVNLEPPHHLEGWISCSSSEEQAEVVIKLAASREYDYIIAEGSTDSSIEPHELAKLLHTRGGAALRVDSLVSVLDGDTLLHDLSAHAPIPDALSEEEAADGGDPGSAADAAAMQNSADTRPMMLVSLVENANVILVSRSADGTQNDPISEVTNLLSVLNGSANILAATDDAVPVEQLVNTNAYSFDNLKLGATWKNVLVASRNTGKGPSRPALPKSLKDATFVYRAKRPFHPVRLYQHIKAVATFHGVIRSTGRIWLATRMLAPLVWNQAGVAATLSLGDRFWAAVPETDWPQEEREREQIMENWDNQYGDRETEIVFVGMGIDKERLQGLLDGCLLQDEEMVFTKMWENIEDPFVEWVPLIEEEDDEEPQEEEDTDIVVDAQPDIEESRADDVVSEAVEVAKVSEATKVFDDMNEATDAAELIGKGSEVADTSSSEDLEGMVGDEDLPDELYDKLSALDIFEQGFSHDSDSEEGTSGLISQQSDDGAYNSDDAVITSWEGSVADGILQQIPKTGLPVTLVTGFLGSGKTTLLNHVLTADHGLKIAVLVNEFGEIDIDNQLVEKGDWNSNDEVMQLANGCICCSINDSFVNAVSMILEREDQPDYLMIETTGVADPVPVINSLMVSDIAEQVRVDGILTLVDAENFDPKTHMDSEVALSQIMASDTILLSKTDIASAKKVEETIEYIQSVRPAARILRSQRGRVPINMILDVGVRVADSPAHLIPVRKGEADGAQELENDHDHDHDAEHETHDHGHSHDHEHGHDAHSHGDHHSHEEHKDHDHECSPDCTHESHSHDHDHSNHLEADGFVTTSFKSDAPLDPQLFMDNFLQKLPEGVFRAKGLLRFYGYGSRYVFQLSGRRYQFDEDDWPEGVAPGNQLVVIGKELDIDALRAILELCLVEDASA